MCSQCNRFARRVELDSLEQYREMVLQLIGIVQDQTLRVVTGTCPLLTLVARRAWPADELMHILQCQSCGRLFEMEADIPGERAVWYPI